MWDRKTLKAKAKAVLKTCYWKAFLVSLLIAIVGGNNSSGSFNFNFNNFDNQSNDIQNIVASGDFFFYLMIFLAILLGIILVVSVLRIFLGYPLEVGGRRFFTQAAQNNVDMNSLSFAFERPKYFNVIKAMLWRSVLNFLWYLLFIIPGIVKSYAYRMVPYILADNPNIGYRRAVELSVMMTRNNKYKIFKLDVSFIGWLLLGTLALFVGVIFVFPYVNATQAELYLVLRQNALEEGLCTSDELMLDNQ